MFKTNSNCSKFTFSGLYHSPSFNLPFRSFNLPLLNTYNLLFSSPFLIHLWHQSLKKCQKHYCLFGFFFFWCSQFVPGQTMQNPGNVCVGFLSRQYPHVNIPQHATLIFCRSYANRYLTKIWCSFNVRVGLSEEFTVSFAFARVTDRRLMIGSGRSGRSVLLLRASQPTMSEGNLLCFRDRSFDF